MESTVLVAIINTLCSGVLYYAHCIITATTYWFPTLAPGVIKLISALPPGERVRFRGHQPPARRGLAQKRGQGGGHRSRTLSRQARVMSQSRRGRYEDTREPGAVGLTQ